MAFFREIASWETLLTVSESFPRAVERFHFGRTPAQFPPGVSPCPMVIEGFLPAGSIASPVLAPGARESGRHKNYSKA